MQLYSLSLVTYISYQSDSEMFLFLKIPTCKKQ
jgi:hypothetical protein